MNLETIIFENNTLKIIDQAKLPDQFIYIQLNSLDEVVRAIKKLNVRGAPAIGITAAYGLYLYARQLQSKGTLDLAHFKEGALSLKNTRPTAVNLGWAIHSMLKQFQDNMEKETEALLERLKQTARQIHRQDKETCLAIGKNGSGLMKDGFRILTHCNAGALATGGSGTALSVIYTATRQGKRLHVFVDETRPVGQGARLTYWELHANDIASTLITDSMAAWLMKEKKINAVIVGADRIVNNGDIANKIGTYGLAILAQYHKIPFYVAAPLSSFDLSIDKGERIPIEMRDENEVLDFWPIKDKTKYKVLNPAFDVTPGSLISAIITEKGVIHQPVTAKKITQFFKN